MSQALNVKTLQAILLMTSKNQKIIRWLEISAFFILVTDYLDWVEMPCLHQEMPEA
jgi:hypothetical protein